MQVFLKNTDKSLGALVENGNPKTENSGPEAAVESTSAPEAVAKAASMLVVLAKNASNVRATVNFLERRGFAAKVASSLNDAVEMFTRKEANMLLLSVNFPHPKVDMLPVLMNQSFQIETILYAEDSDRKSSAKLNNAKTKHVLFGPVSGPVVMMKIRQIDREMSGETDDGEASSSSRVASSKEEGGDIKVGGRKSSNDDTVVLNGKANGDKKAAFDNLMKSLSDDGDEAAMSSGELERSGDTYVAKGERSKMKSADGSDEGDGGGSLSERAQDLRAAIDRGLEEAPPGPRPRLILPNSFARPKRSLKDGSSNDSSDDANEGAEASAESKSQATTSYEAASEALRAAEHEKAVEAARARAEKEAAEAAKKAEKEAALAQSRAEREALAAKQKAEREENAAKMKAEREASAVKAKSDNEASAAARKAERARKEQAAARELTEAEKLALSPEDKVQRCLREALAIVAGAPSANVQQLEKYAQAALISLRTSQMNCAFVVSMHYAKQTANELFHRMQIAFFSLLRDYGVEFENHETYSIFLDNMLKVKDVFAGAEFSIVTQTSEIEMGAARVYVNDPVAKTDPYEENMFSINLRDVPLDEPVTFSLFLHLKRNKKFFKYLKKGASLSGKQVTRLEKHKARALVEQQEVEAYQRHFAVHAIIDPKKRAS